PLEAPGARGELGDVETAGLVDEQGQMLKLDGHVLELVEALLVDAAAPDRAGGNAGLLGYDAGGELLGRHFEREEAYDAAVGGFGVTVRPDFTRAPAAGDVVGDVGGERGLAHAGTAG